MALEEISFYPRSWGRLFFREEVEGINREERESWNHCFAKIRGGKFYSSHGQEMWTVRTE